MCIAALIQTASQSVGMFIGARYVHSRFEFASLTYLTMARFLIGVGVGFAGKQTSTWDQLDH
jgi:hypothetical protein